MAIPTAVMDTNVLVAAMRSTRGASYRLVSLLDGCAFSLLVSVPVLFEHEEQLHRRRCAAGVSQEGVERVLDYICGLAEFQEIHFLWRPQLRDADDDMLLELAANGRADALVTFNVADFAGAERFGIDVVTPQEMLKRLGASPWAKSAYGFRTRFIAALARWPRGTTRL
jgi:putative PIN family toxin of toxin-antitoxin system